MSTTKQTYSDYVKPDNIKKLIDRLKGGKAYLLEDDEKEMIIKLYKQSLSPTSNDGDKQIGGGHVRLSQRADEFFKTHSPDQIYEMLENARKSREGSNDEGEAKDFEFFKSELLVRADRLLRDKGASSKETHDCISLAMDDLKHLFPDNNLLEGDKAQEGVKQTATEILMEIHKIYADCHEAGDEMDYDAEGHAHPYSGMNYEAKINYEQFGKEIEAYFITEYFEPLPVFKKDE